jgi:hypothetical protein
MRPLNSVVRTQSMVTYTPEYEAMQRRWLKSLIVPVIAGVFGLYLFSEWGISNIPTLPPALAFAQGSLNALPLGLWIAGIGGAIIQTFRYRRCPECGTFIERGNKGACRNCALSFGYES